MAAQRPVDGGRHGACTTIRTNAPTHSVHTKADPLQGAELAELYGAVWPSGQESRAACADTRANAVCLTLPFWWRFVQCLLV